MAATQVTEGPVWTLGDRLYKARKQAGLTQHDMAERMEVSRASVSNWENDEHRPYRRSLRQWATITGVSVEWLQRGSPTVTEQYPATLLDLWQDCEHDLIPFPRDLRRAA